jgi:hypothetical protein
MRMLANRGGRKITTEAAKKTAAYDMIGNLG